jgi:peptide chain release factor 3
MSLTTETRRRRTFAIISHPDAGKTTLTEKLLLYANAIHLAGAVQSRKASRHALSDWMKMERERGISVTSSVLQFEHLGKAINLLDTPGHADFSEDTFRTLAAVDSALMLMDHAKGVEPRTRKLFEVCRLRGLPVLTFMNKLDRFGIEPLALLDEVENALDLQIAPVNWPVGMGTDFRGVVDIASRQLHLYEPADHGTTKLRQQVLSWDKAEKTVGSAVFEQVSEELELLAVAGTTWNVEQFLAGNVSPLFWGSAMTNFGVEPLLQFLAQHAAPPASRDTETGETVQPDDERFTGFVFKIQANMNPRHRDRIAFMRVVSGHFERGMAVTIGRSGETLRMAKPHSFLAQERAIVDHAWPGDIVGVYDSGQLRVGDTLATGDAIRYAGIPQFAPEHFGRLRLRNPLKRKALDTGLEQLAQEGVIQVFFHGDTGWQDPFLGAVGLLQFEVLRERLKGDYNVTAAFEPLPYRHARWIGGKPHELTWFKRYSELVLVRDRFGQPAILAESEWTLSYALKDVKGLELHRIQPLGD